MAKQETTVPQEFKRCVRSWNNLTGQNQEIFTLWYVRDCLSNPDTLNEVLKYLPTKLWEDVAQLHCKLTARTDGARRQVLDSLLAWAGHCCEDTPEELSEPENLSFLEEFQKEAVVETKNETHDVLLENIKPITPNSISFDYAAIFEIDQGNDHPMRLKFHPGIIAATPHATPDEYLTLKRHIEIVYKERIAALILLGKKKSKERITGIVTPITVSEKHKQPDGTYVRYIIAGNGRVKACAELGIPIPEDFVVTCEEIKPWRPFTQESLRDLYQVLDGEITRYSIQYGTIMKQLQRRELLEQRILNPKEGHKEKIKEGFHKKKGGRPLKEEKKTQKEKNQTNSKKINIETISAPQDNQKKTVTVEELPIIPLPITEDALLARALDMLEKDREKYVPSDSSEEIVNMFLHFHRNIERLWKLALFNYGFDKIPWEFTQVLVLLEQDYLPIAREVVKKLVKKTIKSKPRGSQPLSGK
jgi:hypothetical protein